MAIDNPTGPGDATPRTTFDEDEREQLAILRQVLFLHPTSLTRDELIRELTAGGLKQVLDNDAAERAIGELAGTGLLHPPCEASLVVPTRAALRYYELSGGAE
jgi:hypothetical protein